MPSEVSDIKQFIEICRRKDAKCTFTMSIGGQLQRKHRPCECTMQGDRED